MSDHEQENQNAPETHHGELSGNDDVSQGSRGTAAQASTPAADPETTDKGQAPKDDAPPVESMRVLEALLFASEELMTTDRLKSILPGQPDAQKIRSMVESINVQLQKQRHPFEIVEIGGGFQFRTVSYYYPWVQQLFKDKAAKKLSIQSLECLAIIAYKQPITKAEIEAIRGVISDGAMKTLLEKRLVTISGRSEKAGRPLLYATTREFLTYFGLNKLADLPRIEEFEALAKEKLGELSEEELQHIESAMPEEEQQQLPGEKTEESLVRIEDIEINNSTDAGEGTIPGGDVSPPA